MLATDLLKRMNDQNPWWTEDNYTPEETAWPKRKYFDSLFAHLRRQQIIAITGLRRIGKTTLMRQLISQLLTSGVPAKNVFYFSFDEELIAKNPDILDGIINTFIETVLVSKIYKLSQTIYIFLDEVQYIPLWQAVLKRFYDASRRVKFVISGSASLYISRKSQESLAGRIIEFSLLPLDFREFLRLRQAELLLERNDLEEMLLNPSTVDQNRYLSHRENLNALFQRFIFQGGFPEIIRENDDRFVLEYLNSSVIAKIVGFDLVRFFDIKREDVLLGLMKFASKSTGGLLEFQSLAKSLNANRETIVTYLAYLQKAFLVNIIYNYTASVAKQLRTTKKIFIAHPNLCYAALGLKPDNPLLENMLGPLAETYVYNVLRTKFADIHFWREREKEVDFVVTAATKTLPIEVKYKNTIDNKDLRNLVYFCRKRKLSEGIVITKYLLGEKQHNGINIKMLPITVL